MDKCYVEYFGRMLMECVRDRTIYSFDKAMIGKIQGDMGAQYAEFSEYFTEEQMEIIRKHIIPDLVDKCIFNLLHCIEVNEDIDIIVEGENETKRLKEINKQIAIRFLEENGWKDLYSKNK